MDRIRGEKWAPVKGYKGLYRVSTLGRVRSVSREVIGKDGRITFYEGVVLRPGDLISRSGKKYKIVSLWKNGKGRMWQVHRLVGQAFIPNPDNKPEINHIDGNPSNNRVGNLEWATRLENVHHALATGLTDYSKRKCAKGTRNGNSKLTERQVREIKRRLALGESCYRVCKDYPVSEVTVGNIRSGKVWSHVK